MGEHNEHGAVVDERIERICSMMRDLTFRTGKTVKELAREWGLAEKTVREYTAEASKRVLAEIKDPDKVQATGLSKLEAMIDDSISDASKAGPDASRHRKNAMDGIRMLLELTGSAAAKRIKLEYDELSEADLEKKAAELAAKLADIAKK